MLTTLFSVVMVLADVPAPSVVVTPLRAKEGVRPAVTELLTSTLTAKVRARNVFSRVIGPQDIETLMSLERQQQMLDCSSSSCLAELAGALGAEQTISGDVGRLGGTFVMNLMLIDNRKAAVLGSAAQTIRASDESAVLAVLDGMIDVLLAHRVADNTVQQPVRTESKGVSPAAIAGGVVAGLGGLGLVVGIGAALGATALFAAVQLSDFYVGNGWGAGLTAAMLGGWGGGALLGVIAMLVCVAGAGLVTAGLVMR